MNWTLLLIPAAILAAVLTADAGSGPPDSTAREQLKNGAVLVDVRTPKEFDIGHLANAVNIPLAELKEKLPARVPDKSKMLLLYCHSGHRSGIAEQQLRSLGYTNIVNLGSYTKAEKAVGAGSKSGPEK